MIKPKRFYVQADLFELPKTRRVGHYLSGMIMPNVSVFITWGIITTLIQYLRGPLQSSFLEMDRLMIQFLFPVLIAYTGGRLIENRAGVVAAVAVIGMLTESEDPQILGAMVIGPLIGWIVFLFDKYVLPKVKPGYEMLVRNFSAGILGMLFGYLSLVFIGPIIAGITNQIGFFVGWLIQRNLLLFTNLFIEPLKVLFLNNTLNHGILTPLGIEQAGDAGTSILFLIETNPGPGLGVLLAFILFSRKELKATASGAFMIHLFGGIHEIYFPFVLLNPLLFAAVILGGMSGTLIFEMFQVGLKVPASPGSIVVILANAPQEMLLGVASGIAGSTLVSFIIAALVIRKDQTKKEISEKVTKVTEIRTILFACDAGMGSSAMGASLMRQQLQASGISIPVDYTSIYRVNDDPHLLLITQNELKHLAEIQAPHAQLVTIGNFLDQEEYTKVITMLTDEQENEMIPEAIGKKLPYQKVIFLYADGVRGSQTMAVQAFRNLAEKQNIGVDVEKQPLEQLIADQHNLYIVTEAFAAENELPKGPLLVVEHLIATNKYEKLLRGDLSDVSNS
ncbi:MAG: PTS transporter subunit EIIC [Trichococcus flocculiformis]|jgi:PTS system mannitol-specific IIC component|uniref:PTS transporter subunit EIIC n=1 Tax=Trichococcus flocculiformis TaxID=82803 RepID=UPI000E98E99E|nr:PTS transporter subunit EIIC [Trichococcus flocculiformis]MBP6246788.1 PTS transporter subunit EIIC [Trichococcus sp.]NCB64976.1 PTS lactose transporter subunit IIBC [Bacilli bacterium]MBP7128288.1 PTS transporter subunit EIIC [Trichococcus sp.]MBP8682886.1 PTS transporter subunit EIIC [Trichococcus sp.]MBP9594649.1 PTS transporter subunit EIIC [Trichococcus sp.]